MIQVSKVQSLIMYGTFADFFRTFNGTHTQQQILKGCGCVALVREYILYSYISSRAGGDIQTFTR